MFGEDRQVEDHGLEWDRLRSQHDEKCASFPVPRRKKLRKSNKSAKKMLPSNQEVPEVSTSSEIQGNLERYRLSTQFLGQRNIMAHEIQHEFAQLLLDETLKFQYYPVWAPFVEFCYGRTVEELAIEDDNELDSLYSDL